MTIKAKHTSDINALSDNPFPGAFHSKMGVSQVRALSDAFALSHFGVNHESLAPGSSSGLKHWHSGSEEFVLVLTGQLTLYYGDSVQLMSAGMCIGFVANEGIGHRLVNESEHEASFLVVGSRVAADRVEYDEDDIQWLETDDGHWYAARKDGEPYDV